MTSHCIQDEIQHLSSTLKSLPATVMPLPYFSLFSSVHTNMPSSLLPRTFAATVPSPGTHVLCPFTQKALFPSGQCSNASFSELSLDPSLSPNFQHQISSRHLRHPGDLAIHLCPGLLSNSPPDLSPMRPCLPVTALRLWPPALPH